MAFTTPERIAELDAIEAHRKLEEEQANERATKEAQQIAEAKRKQLYLDYARMFSAIDSVDVPTQYNLEIGEMVAIDSVCRGFVNIFLNTHSLSQASILCTVL